MTPALAFQRFLLGCALGAGLGLYYGFLRPLRPRWLGAVLFLPGLLWAWLLLGFDPIRTDLYGSEDLKQDNKFFQYYEDNIFAAIEGTLDSVAPTCLIDTYPVAADIVKQQMAYNLFILRQDPATVAQDCAEELRMMIE